MTTISALAAIRTPAQQEAARGVLVTNDLSLGRRARNAGVRWIRTADLVVLAYRSERVTKAQAVAALHGLADAGRITAALADAYLEDLS